MDLDQLEAFALAEDRDAAVAQLIPGTESYYYYKCLVAQQRGELDRVDELVTTWRKRHGSSSELETIETRQLVLRLEDRTDEVCETIRRELGLDFSHQREAELKRGAHPSRLDPDHLDAERLTSTARVHHPGQSVGFTDRGLVRLLDRQDLDPGTRQHLLSRLSRPDHPRLVEHIAADIKARRAGFGSLTIHRRLLPDQLAALAQRIPALRSDPTFVECRLVHLQPNPDEPWQSDLDLKRDYLDRLWREVSMLGPAFNSLKAHILYHRLDVGLELGQYPFELFYAYLRTPRAVHYLARKFRDANKAHAAHLGSEYASTLLPPVHDDEHLVREYLRELLIDAEELGDLTDLLDRNKLRSWFATIKILGGTGDLERWHELFDDDSAFAFLRDRVDIDLDRRNKQRHEVDENVTISARIKNVKTLMVNVFEINALNFALRCGQLPDTSIDLDGLVASDSQTFRYDEPPFRSVPRKFELDQLRGPGVYVVELLGGGKSSRALVRKGGLRAVERIGAAGHVFAVYDEGNNRVSKPTMHLGGTVLTADERGEIVVPFSSRPQRQSAVVTGNGRVEVVAFAHVSESYSLAAGIFVAREALIAGNNATVIIRPTLRVSSTRIARTLLENPIVVVETTDRRGVSARREIRDLDLAAPGDLTTDFRVPENLAAVSITLEGSVRSVSEQKDIELSSSAHFSVNGIDAQEDIDALHLGRNGSEQVVFALGKNGEPRADLAISLTIRHRDFTDRIETTLQTDEAGRIELGDLSGIDELSVRAPSGVSANWVLEPPRSSLPVEVHSSEGETLSLATIDGDVSLLERRVDGFVADHSGSARHNAGALIIEGLPAGDFELFLRTEQRALALRVAAGERQAGHIFGRRRILQASPGNCPRIGAIEVSDKHVRIAISGQSARARVHIEAARFMGSRSPWDCIGHLARPTRLRGIEVPLPGSFYVSGRDLGDEYRYILERRLAEKIPGAAVGRPALLLNPWSREATETETVSPMAGSAYGAAAPPASARALAAPAPRPKRTVAPSAAAFASVDFLAHPAVVLANLEVVDGVVEVERSSLANASAARILLVDDDFATSREVTFPEPTLSRRDLRLDEALPADEHASQLRRVAKLVRSDSLVVKDVASATVDVVDDIGRVHALYCALSGNATLAEFGFIARWPSLTEGEQSELYSKYACHELHLFLHFKDDPFFRRVIAPYLADKQHPTFLDHYFTRGALDRYLEPWRYGRLNTLEQILLAGRLGDAPGATRSRIRDRVELVPRDLSEEKRLFDAVVGGSALAEDKLGFREAAKEVRHENKTRKRKAMAPQAQSMPMAAEEMAFDDESEVLDMLSDDDFDQAESGYGGEDERRRDAGRRSAPRLFRAPDKTKEWAENNYWHLRPEQQGPELITPNRFWLDFALHEALRAPSEPFLSQHFAEATANFTEMMAALAVLDLPFASGEHDASYDGAQMNLTAGSAALVFHKQIAPAPVRPEAVPILVSQNYFRADDRYLWEGGERLDKYVTGEMLTHVVYLCQVVLTNPTSSPKKLQILLQNPEGSLPVSGGTAIRGEPIELSPYGTQALEYAFYFPETGDFAHYGAQVTLDEEQIASVESGSLKVVRTLSEVDTTSWAHVSQHGDDRAVLEHLGGANLARIDLTKIAWRMRDRTMFDATVAALDDSRVFDYTLWSYAVHHGVPQRVCEFLRHSDDLLQRLGPELSVGPLELEPIARGWYEHLEYAPLVNARAHRLGSRRQIANKALESQYRRALERLCHLPTLRDNEWLEVAYYMFVQDRLADALTALAKVSDDARGVHVDYMRAFAALAQGDLEAARTIAEGQANHPVDRWRARFDAVLGALARSRGADAVVTDADDRRQEHDALAAKTASFEVSCEDASVILRHRLLNSVQVHYYLMDTELLFSRQPFLREATERFSVVQPNSSAQIELDSSGGEHRIEIPAELVKKNVVIEVEGEGNRQSVVRYAHDLSVQVIERFGQLRVGEASGTPIAGAYVKVYARKHDGAVEFYKDGYTDLTGSFDYASLSTDDLDHVERFALLLVEPEHGSLIREAGPPPR